MGSQIKKFLVNNAGSGQPGTRKAATNDGGSGRSGWHREHRGSCETRTSRSHCGGGTKGCDATSVSRAPLETAGNTLAEPGRLKTQASSRPSEPLISSACRDRNCVRNGSPGFSVC